MRSGRAFAIAAVAALTLVGGVVHAAQQSLTGKKVKIQNLDPGGDPSRRRITFQANERPSDATLVGDPTVGGATLNIQLDAQGQCFPMPASGWAAVSTSSFKYKDPTGANGPVRVALIKRKPGGGVFQIKATVLGFQGAGPQPIITIVPPGTILHANFAVGGGDEYCTTFGGTILPNDTRIFMAKNSPDPGSCAIPLCP